MSDRSRMRGAAQREPGGRLCAREATLFLGNAGTAMRPLTASLAVLAATQRGRFELGGVARMHERPIGDLVDALRQLGCGVADPECQGRAVDLDALALQHLRLAIQRQVPGVLADQNVGHQRFRRQSAANQPLRRRREVTHLDYGGVGELVARRRELPGRGGELVIAVRNPYVANILKAAGGSELAFCRNPEEAFAEVAVARAGAARRRQQ